VPYKTWNEDLWWTYDDRDWREKSNNGYYHEDYDDKGYDDLYLQLSDSKDTKKENDKNGSGETKPLFNSRLL